MARCQGSSRMIIDRKDILTPDQKLRKRRVRTRQIGGDDGYQWCLIIDGQTAYNGMTRNEAFWRRDRFIKEGEL